MRSFCSGFASLATNKPGSTRLLSMLVFLQDLIFLPQHIFPLFQGIGVQFSPDESSRVLRDRIEKVLAGHLGSSRPTHTL